MMRTGLSRNFGTALGLAAISKAAIAPVALPTNLFLKSQDFTNAAWIRTALTTVTADTTLDPLGTTLADSLVATAVDTSHNVRQAVTTTAVQHTVSWYAKPGNQNFTGMYISSIANGVMFNISAGTVGSRYGAAANCTGAIVAAANGFFRCSITFTATAATPIFYLYSSDADWAANGTNTETFIGDAVTVNTILFGAQLETGATAGTYVATL